MRVKIIKIIEKSNNNHEEYLDINNQEEHNAVENQWKILEERRKNMPKSIKISGQEFSKESIENIENIHSDEVPKLKKLEEKPKVSLLDTKETTRMTSKETTTETKVETQNVINLTTLVKDLISQVSELKKEIKELKSSKESTKESSNHTMLKPEDDRIFSLDKRHEKYTEYTEKILSIPQSHPELDTSFTVKKVEERNINIENNIQSYEETGLKENILAAFPLEISGLNENKSFNYPDIFTDDLADLEKVPAEIVLNSLLNGSMDTIKILDSFINNNHVRVVEYTENFHSIENFYINNNKAYFLSIDQWPIVYDIISECKNLSVLKKTIKKNPYMVYTLSKEIENCVLSIQRSDHPYANCVPTESLCKVINKSLNYILINHYEREKPANNLFLNYYAV